MSNVFYSTPTISAFTNVPHLLHLKRINAMPCTCSTSANFWPHLGHVSRRVLFADWLWSILTSALILGITSS